jgi:hypothetical protein
LIDYRPAGEYWQELRLVVPECPTSVPRAS